MPEQPTISTPFISVKALSRYYGPIHAVRNISFDVQRGEVLGFLGPNGAGKSTTMQMLAGNLAPTSGQILINGIDLLDQPKRAKADIGYLPEQPPLYKELTVDEYLAYAARINRIARTQQRQGIDAAKQRCGLTDVGRRLIGNLSKGFQQRVGIAQAIIHSPAIVILDEPTVGLDPIQIREIRHLIRELGDSHGVILSTHILPEVQATCDRVQIIHNGELVLSDSLAHINEDTRPSSLTVAFEKPPAESALAALQQVQSVETLGTNRFRVHFDPAHNPATHIAQQAVTQGWGLLELTPQQRTLEEIFVQITSREHHADTSTQETGAEEHAA